MNNATDVLDTNIVRAESAGIEHSGNAGGATLLDPRGTAITLGT